MSGLTKAWRSDDGGRKLTFREGGEKFTFTLFVTRWFIPTFVYVAFPIHGRWHRWHWIAK